MMDTRVKHEYDICMKHILLIGCGNMGGALAKAWRAKLADITLHVIDPSTPGSYASLADLANNMQPDAVVFAVKPQAMDDVLGEYAARFGDAPLCISVAAGKTLAYYGKHLGASARIIRVMPNTPAQISEGVSALIATAGATDADRALAESLFAAAGHVIWLSDEAQMHAVTALSGSGPAYVFLFLDALAQAGVSLGLEESTARALAVHTLRGAAGLALKSDESFARLRQNVTSPGGTTEAALHALMRDERLFRLVTEACLAAAKRSEQLGI